MGDLRKYMEEICKVGHAYYKNLSKEEEKLAKDVLKKIDLNEEGKVGREELKTFIQKQKLSKKFASWEFFNVLGENSHKNLNDEQVIPLYFLSKRKPGVMKCDNCGKWLMGAYFSCFQCFRNVGNTYDLCRECYRSRNHEHKHSIFYDSQTLLYKIRPELQSSSSYSSICSLNKEREEKDQEKRKIPAKEEETDKLQLTAKASYGKVSKNIRAETEKFVNKMDKDKNKVPLDGKCKKCSKLLEGAYFSCFKCFRDVTGNTYDLCCECYGSRNYKHKDSIFYDSQTLLYKIRPELQRSSSYSSTCSLNKEKEEKDQEKRKIPAKEEETDELQLTAEAYYKTVSKNIKAKADEFLHKMDKDENKEVSFSEYISYLKKEGHNQMANKQFFNYLNKSKTGNLNHEEVMKLYYIIQSERPFCDSCANFIKGLFFTCLNCFYEADRPTFNVCPSCFHKGVFVHSFSEHKCFVDNFSLLQAMRPAPNQDDKKRETCKACASRDRQGKQEADRREEKPYRSSTSTDIIPYHPRNTNAWLSILSSIISIGAGVVSCTIM